MASTKQASFHRSASGVEHEKHGCVWHFHGVVRGDHVVSPLWSTSELTVSDRSNVKLGKLYGGTRQARAVMGRGSEARRNAMREREVVLPFPVVLGARTPYNE